MKFSLGLWIFIAYCAKVSGLSALRKKVCSWIGCAKRNAGHSSDQSVIKTETTNFLEFSERERIDQCPQHHHAAGVFPATETGAITNASLKEITNSIESRDMAEGPQFPNLANENSETIPKQISASFAGEYALKLLAVNAQASLLIPSVNPKRLIFKYQMNCVAKEWLQTCQRAKSRTKQICDNTKDDPHRDPEALLREYAFTKIVFDRTTLAPEPYFLSPAVAISDASGERVKTNFTNVETPNEVALCVEVGTTVRLLVEQLVGSTISGFFAGNLSGGDTALLQIDRIRLRAKIFHESLVMLERLHAIAIVHGDFHYGNLAFREMFDVGHVFTKEEKLDLVFIDFGNAVVIEESSEPEVASLRRFYFLNHVALSPFQLKGYRVSRRDDIYRAFEAFIDSLVFGSLRSLFAFADENDPQRKLGQAVLVLKSALDFSSEEQGDIDWSQLGGNSAIIEKIKKYPGLKQLQTHLGNADRFAKVQTILREIQWIVRDEPSSISPNYGCLIAKALEIVDLLYA